MFLRRTAVLSLTLLARVSEFDEYSADVEVPVQ